jgi:RNA polymerase-binding transcription factor DksA
MNKKLKEKLIKEKTEIETSLKSFAKKDKKLPHDWDTCFPHFDNEEAGSSALEKAADEVEEYSNLLPVEYSLELKLKNINSALRKMKSSLKARSFNTSRLKKNKYGLCEKCGKTISQKRLMVSPEAKFCIKCRK